jgi:hypothetical protein
MNAAAGEDVLGDGLAAERIALAVVERRRAGRAARRAAGGLLGQLALGVAQAGVDLLARFFQHAAVRSSLWRMRSTSSCGALVALVQAVGDAGDLVADIVDGQGVAALGVADALGQLLGDAGDFGAQLLEGLGLDAVGAVQLVLVEAMATSADLLDGGGVAGSRRPGRGGSGRRPCRPLRGPCARWPGPSAARRPARGRPSRRACAPCGRSGRRPFRAAWRPSPGGRLPCAGSGCRPDSSRRFCTPSPGLRSRRFADGRPRALNDAFSRAGPRRCGSRRLPGVRPGGPRPRRPERGRGIAGWADAGWLIQALFQMRRWSRGCGPRLRRGGRRPCPRPLPGAKRLGRTRTGGFGLDAAQPLGGARLVGLDLVHRAFEAGGHGDLFTLGGDQALSAPRTDSSMPVMAWAERFSAASMRSVRRSRAMATRPTSSAGCSRASMRGGAPPRRSRR